MNRNKIIASVVSMLLISSMITACGASEPVNDVTEETSVSETDVKDTEEKTENVDAEIDIQEPQEVQDEVEVLAESEANDFNAAYLNKIAEYNANGTADNFALIEIKGVSTPALTVANSEGPLDEGGNVHLFIAPDGNLNELLSVSEGFDGSHIYISDEENTILQTGGMSGTEIYTLYSINGTELEISNELFAIFDIENDTYTYKYGEIEISEDEYFIKFDEMISANNPYTGVDHDRLNKVNISIKDGYVDFESVSSDKYLSFDEIKVQLEK